jgi:acyl-CoA thioester hydrolase
MVTPTDRYVSCAEFFVRYAETDTMGIVHHSSYVLWMEEARIHYGRVRGTDYAEFERAGFALSIVELQVRYVSPSRFGDQIAARCWVEELKSRSIAFGYEIADARGNSIFATGHTRHLCINREGKVAALPVEWRERWL